MDRLFAQEERIHTEYLAATLIRQVKNGHLISDNCSSSLVTRCNDNEQRRCLLHCQWLGVGIK